MKLRFKLGAVASALALAASLGVAFAGPAAAASDVRLCVSQGKSGPAINCAVDVGEGLNVMGAPENGTSGSAWNAPTSGKGEIVISGGTNYCMELNASKKDKIYLEPCKHKASEEWDVVVGATVFGNQTVTAYVYQNVYKKKLCLTGPATAKSGDLYGKKCGKLTAQTENWMQCGPNCG
jgi:hypothetical protein